MKPLDERVQRAKGEVQQQSGGGDAAENKKSATNEVLLLLTPKGGPKGPIAHETAPPKTGHITRKNGLCKEV